MEARRPTKLTSFFDRIRRFFDAKAAQEAARTRSLERECEQLRARLRESDERGRARIEALYNLQRQYSTEHFAFQESMRNLQIERMRNAGMFADRDVVLARAKDLQARIRSLKKRLRAYEPVDDALFDETPIVIEESPSDRGAASGS